MPAKTYVLVHGAYHGAWCWRDVTPRLRAAGHAVYTPTWTGLGERSHLLPFRPTLETFIEDVLQVLRFEDLEDVILVGHSFAGSILSAAADRMPERLRHLVYLDANILFAGESSADRGPARVAEYRRRAMAHDGGLSIPPNPPAHFGVFDPDIAAWVASKLTPHPMQTYDDKLVLKHPLLNGLPATYIACTSPYNASTESARETARGSPGWTYLEIATGHDAMCTAPAELTAMLLAIGGTRS